MDEDLLRYSNKIESTDLRQWPYVINWLTKRRPILSDITVRNICESFTHKMAAKTSWHSIERNYVTVTLRIFYLKNIYLYFSTGNGQPREPALCHLYRHTFVPYKSPDGILRALAVQLTVQRHVASTYFVPIGCRHSELGRIVRELQFVRCERDLIAQQGVAGPRVPWTGNDQVTGHDECFFRPRRSFWVSRPSYSQTITDTNNIDCFWQSRSNNVNSYSGPDH